MAMPLSLQISQGVHMTSESGCHVPGISYNKLHTLFIITYSLYACIPVHQIRDSAVVIATCCQLDSRGLIPSRGKKFLPTPQHPDWFQGPTSLLSNGYQRPFQWGVKWTSIVVIRNGGAIPPLLHTYFGTTLPYPCSQVFYNLPLQQNTQNRDYSVTIQITCAL
jgi:hypothetical protein